MHYCFQEKGSGALLFSGEGTCTGALLSSKRRKLVLNCSSFDQEKGKCSTVSGKGDGAVLYSVLKRKEVVLYQVNWLTVMKVGTYF